jgi:HptB-dependent secretion and biofilm anti anti-sigma factor
MRGTVTMVISSRTPEGRPSRCAVCGSDINIEPSDPADDGPCPVCGHLLWFTGEIRGADQVVRLPGHLLQAESLDAVSGCEDLQPGMRLVLDFSEVECVSSAALGRLISLKRRVGALRGQLVLRAVHPDVLDVLRVTRLDQFFTVEA